VRITPDARGYIPLSLGMVLAGRVRLGFMDITSSSIAVGSDDTFGVQQRLRDLGPLRQRLRGGGNNSVRGYQPNTLGDITRAIDVNDSGGLRQWEASLELRAPITSSFGAVVFADIGDVTRDHSFRFSAWQPSFGFGLRYRTLIGPIRFDIGFAPRSLQYFGSVDPRTRETLNSNGVPRDFHESRFLGADAAVHFTIGEAY
jgi:outer membrane protein assembly factor BamA